jgi:Na+-driven multidrug efflux pump
LTALATLTPPSAVICGLAAIVSAVVGWRRGDRLGRVALVVAVLVLAFGLVTGGLLVLLDELGLWDTGWGG